MLFMPNPNQLKTNCPSTMRKFLPLFACLLFITGLANAQCTTASLNWDALKFLAPGTYVTAAMASNQNFALGKNKVNITYSGGVTSNGENASHTGHANTYGVGNDVMFSNNGTITLTFATAVSNLKFSIYDIDKGQVISFTALNGASSILPVVSKADPTSTLITLTNSAT